MTAIFIYNDVQRHCHHHWIISRAWFYKQWMNCMEWIVTGKKWWVSTWKNDIKVQYLYNIYNNGTFLLFRLKMFLILSAVGTNLTQGWVEGSLVSTFRDQKSRQLINLFKKFPKISKRSLSCSKNKAAVSIFSGMGLMYWSDCFREQSNGFYSMGGMLVGLWGLVIAMWCGFSCVGVLELGGPIWCSCCGAYFRLYTTKLPRFAGGSNKAGTKVSNQCWAIQSIY